MFSLGSLPAPPRAPLRKSGDDNAGGCLPADPVLVPDPRGKYYPRKLYPRDRFRSPAETDVRLLLEAVAKFSTQLSVSLRYQRSRASSELTCPSTGGTEKSRRPQRRTGFSSFGVRSTTIERRSECRGGSDNSWYEEQGSKGARQRWGEVTGLKGVKAKRNGTWSMSLSHSRSASGPPFPMILRIQRWKTLRT